MATVREVKIFPGEDRKSTSIHTVQDVGQMTMHVEIDMQNHSPADSHSDAYAKRVNYWVLNLYDNSIETQGTLYYSSTTGYLKNRVSYAFGITGIEHRLFLEAPDKKGHAYGKITTYPL